VIANQVHPPLSLSLKTKFILSSCWDNKKFWEESIGHFPLSQSQSYLTTDGHSASLSWCQAPIRDPWPMFLLLFLINLVSYGFVDMGRPLWREVGSVVFNCCWASPAKSFSGMSRAGLMFMLYCLKFFRLFQSWAPGSYIYIPLEQGSPVIPSSIGFTFLRNDTDRI
jgi:hypothetical protein